ncbi:MAG: DeoR/GlpR family DNA-binding transcription regulator [Treponemataceae bacterium]
MQSPSDAAHGQLPAKRHAEIYELARRNGIVKVADLAESLGVTEMTIRRDLEVLERKGLVERIHGGAIINARVGLEPLYVQKSALHLAEKQAIGRLATTLIEDGDTVFVNSGSTTIQFLEQLDARVKVITNNPLAPLHVRSDKIDVLITGGELRRESLTLVGETAQHVVRQVFANKAVIGVDGFSIRHGLTNPTQAESYINRLMIKMTHGEVILVADSSKAGKVANFLTVPIKAVTTIVTDDRIDERLAEEFRKIGIRVLLAGAEEGHRDA